MVDLVGSRLALYHGATGQQFDSGTPIERVVGDLVLASGRISAPVSGIVLALPAGFSAFDLSLRNFQIGDTTPDAISAALSFDGGQTYLTDDDEFNAYSMTGYQSVFNLSQDTLEESTAFSVFDSLIDFTFVAGIGNVYQPQFGTDIDIRINPGSDVEFSRLFFRSSYAGLATADILQVADWGTAVVGGSEVGGPGVKARATNIIIQVYGDGVVPHAEPTFIAGDYTLMGVY